MNLEPAAPSAFAYNSLPVASTAVHAWCFDWMVTTVFGAVSTGLTMMYLETVSRLVSSPKSKSSSKPLTARSVKHLEDMVMPLLLGYLVSNILCTLAIYAVAALSPNVFENKGAPVPLVALNILACINVGCSIGSGLWLSMRIKKRKPNTGIIKAF